MGGFAAYFSHVVTLEELYGVPSSGTLLCINLAEGSRDGRGS